MSTFSLGVSAGVLKWMGFCAFCLFAFVFLIGTANAFEFALLTRTCFDLKNLWTNSIRSVKNRYRSANGNPHGPVGFVHVFALVPVFVTSMLGLSENLHMRLSWCYYFCIPCAHRIRIRNECQTSYIFCTHFVTIGGALAVICVVTILLIVAIIAAICCCICKKRNKAKANRVSPNDG